MHTHTCFLAQYASPLKHIHTHTNTHTHTHTHTHTLTHTLTHTHEENALMDTFI